MMYVLYRAEKFDKEGELIEMDNLIYEKSPFSIGTDSKESALNYMKGMQEIQPQYVYILVKEL